MNVDATSMTINERIRYLRKNLLKKNQTEFATAIGMKQTGLSYIEKNNATVRDQVIKSVCTVFNVNENWLRQGIPPVLIKSDSSIFDEVVTQYHLGDMDKEILRLFLNLEPEQRKAVSSFALSLAQAASQKIEKNFTTKHMDDLTSKLEELERKYQEAQAYIAALEEKDAQKDIISDLYTSLSGSLSWKEPKANKELLST